MKILLVEDDAEKQRRIIDFLRELEPAAQITSARSLQSGLGAIARSHHDLVILDMTMPTFDIGQGESGGDPQAYGGRDLLQHMKRRRITTPAIVITQFDRFGGEKDTLTRQELDDQLRSAHPEQYRGCVYFDVSASSWRDELRRLLLEIRQTT